MVKTGWLVGLVAALSLGTAVTVYERGKVVVQPKPPRPITYVLPSRSSIEDSLIGEDSKKGYVVQMGDTYPSIGEKLYGSKEAGKRLKSINDFMGRTSIAMAAVVTDEPEGRTQRDWAWREQKVRVVYYPYLGVGDTLFTLRYMSGFDGMSYQYSVPVSESAIDSVLMDTRFKVIDSLGYNVRFIDDEPFGRRFDEGSGGDFVGSKLPLIY